MHTLIVFNHPYPGSYCTAVLQAVKNGLLAGGHTCDLLHLDEEFVRGEFNPVMTQADLEGFRKGRSVDPKVLEYGARLERAEHLVLIFPIWWELMPALTKGFIDKVIFPGVAYDYDHSGRFPRMVKRWPHLERITLITTMNTHSFFYRLVFGNAIKRALFTGTFWKMGYGRRRWINLNMVKFVSPKKRAKWLAQMETRFAKSS